ncbi:MAG: ribosome biogenesis GTPase Der [bacterium]
MTSIVAIVGRPNVGKSRLFNRLSESQRAIVLDFEGVTRDRQYADAEWYGRHYTLIDTGGFVPTTDEPLLQLMRSQAQLAIEEADIIIFMMDSKQGIVTADQQIADQLRRTSKPTFYVVNKVDAYNKKDEALAEFYALGVDLYAVSAEHGHGLDNLMDAVAEFIPKGEPEVSEDPFAKVAVVGKPNAGKSSTVNALLGENRLLTSDIPGTTRDSVDTMVTYDDRDYLIIDTAGLRKKSVILEKLEEYSVVQAIRSIDRADVALLVIDATEGVTTQDKKIASVVDGRGRACVVVVNKWDLVVKDNSTAGEWVKMLRYEMPFLVWAPIIFVSAKTGQRVHKILGEVDRVFEQYKRRISTSELNRFLTFVMEKHSPPMYQNRKLKFYYATQAATRPPRFVFVVNHPKGIAPAYRKFLENQIREEWGFEGTPIKTLIRERRRREDLDRTVYD